MRVDLSWHWLYPVLFGLALLGGMWRTRRVRNPDAAGWAYLVAVWSGFLGAHLWRAAQYGGWTRFGGLSAWGFVMGAFLGALICLRWSGEGWGGDFWDAQAPVIAAGGAIVRIGCFLSGCDFGATSSLRWAVRYPAHSPAWEAQAASGRLHPALDWSLPIHPVQIYESLALLSAALVLTLFGRRLPRHEPFLGLVVYYGASRFLLEFLRGDAGGAHLGWLSFAQATSLAFLGLALIVFCRNRRRRARLPS
jgi:phosphatidylglycerol:prolipoprotein diacylglycerol transferase